MIMKKMKMNVLACSVLAVVIGMGIGVRCAVADPVSGQADDAFIKSLKPVANVVKDVETGGVYLNNPHFEREGDPTPIYIAQRKGFYKTNLKAAAIQICSWFGYSGGKY